MRGSAWLVSALLLTGCGQQTERKESSRDLTTFDVTEESAVDSAMNAPPPPPPPVSSRAPGISVTAAPGVAFNYAYAFRLPSPRISPMQEAHAQMCEKLGLARCRITGMRYRLANERDISAVLALKLDPAIAREFGKQATALVTRSEGMLVDQEISGIDAGSSIANANRGEAQIRDDIAKLDAELRRPGLSNVVRDRLLAEAAELRAQLRQLDTGREADRESLARTPMVFNYGSGSLIPGFDTSSPLRDAWEEAAAMFVGALGLIIRLLAALIPFMLLAALAWAVYRRFAPARLRAGARAGGRHHREDEAAEATTLDA
jgi:hypothetical protein